LDLSPKDLSRIVVLTKEYDPKRHPMMSRCRELLISRIQLEHPGWSEFDVTTILRAIEKDRQLQGQEQVVEQQTLREVGTMLEQFEEALASEKELQAAEEEAAAEAQAAAEEKEKRLALLNQLREQKQEAEAVKLQEQLEQQEAEARQKELEEKRYYEDLARRMEEAAKVRQLRAAEELARAREYEEIQKAQEVKKKEEAKINAERVSFRHKVYDSKVEMKRDELQAKRDAEREKEQKLDKFFQTVEKNIGVGRDSERVLKPTVASAQDSGPLQHLLGEHAHRLTAGKMAGYSDAQVTKDPRYRLTQALVAAGLHTTLYARQLLHQGGQRGSMFKTSGANPLSFF
jgi:hypothetical protein